METEKRLLMSMLTLSLVFSLGGCFLWHSATPKWVLPPDGYYRLTVDFSTGSFHGRLEFRDFPIKNYYYDSETKTFSDEAYEAAAMDIAEYLSEWTGLDFILNSVTSVEGGWIVDWSKDSTLIAGLDDRELEEPFRFDDTVSLNWFMMDSLYRSLTEISSGAGTYYYYSDGQPIVFSNQEEMVAAYGLPPIPTDERYYGSYYYSEAFKSGSK